MVRRRGAGRRGAERRGAEQRVAGQRLVQHGAPGAEGRRGPAVAAHALVRQRAAQRAPWGQVPVEGALRVTAGWERGEERRQGAGPGALQVPAGPPGAFAGSGLRPWPADTKRGAGLRCPRWPRRPSPAPSAMCAPECSGTWRGPPRPYSSGHAHCRHRSRRPRARRPRRNLTRPHLNVLRPVPSTLGPV